MHFATSALALLGSAAALASANKVTFRTVDDVKRTVYFTANDNQHFLDPVDVDSSEDTTVDFPDSFVGNFYAVPKGGNNSPGMLGEVQFGGWNGKTYFDVSAIVDATDKTNVKVMYPAQSKCPTSGCDHFPCDNAYYVWDDVQTKVTEEDHIITVLGNGESGVSSC
jgi:hypothetical protein